MSRGKKAKKKIVARRKQDSSVVASSVRLTGVDGSSVTSINKSHTLELSSKLVKAKPLRSKSVEIAERTSKLVITESRDFDKKQDPEFIGKSINASNLAIFFKTEELETLRNVLRRTDLSKTPLLLGAIILGKVDVVKRLLRDGYPINSQSEEDKTTALMWAVRRKDLEMINLLVRNGADLTLLDENNDNVALIAVQSSSWDQNDFLDFWYSIDRKIDLKHVNTRGYTILHYARERQWHILAKLIDRNSTLLTRIDSISKNPCFCCYCSTASSTIPRYKSRKVLPSDYMESTLSHLTVLFDEIVNRYREIWSRDRDLGYPDFRGGDGGDTGATTFDDLVSLRREEIARLNTVLPKLEESYLQKLRDCWSSLVAKMRQTVLNDARKFEEFVTSIQIQLLTHQVSPGSDERLDVKPPTRNNNCPEIQHFPESAHSSSQKNVQSSSLNFEFRPRVTDDS